MIYFLDEGATGFSRLLLARLGVNAYISYG